MSDSLIPITLLAATPAFAVGTTCSNPKKYLFDDETAREALLS
jgi:hypothetical protein